MPATDETLALDALLAALAELDTPAPHVQNTRTHRVFCGGKSYAIGFSPCELTAFDGKAPADCPGIQAQRRVAVKRAARRYATVAS